jgi:hypothetical protein
VGRGESAAVEAREEKEERGGCIFNMGEERTRWRENKMKRKKNINIKVLEHLREFPKSLLNPCFLAR